MSVVGPSLEDRLAISLTNSSNPTVRFQFNFVSAFRQSPKSSSTSAGLPKRHQLRALSGSYGSYLPEVLGVHPAILISLVRKPEEMTDLTSTFPVFRQIPFSSVPLPFHSNWISTTSNDLLIKSRTEWVSLLRPR